MKRHTSIAASLALSLALVGAATITAPAAGAGPIYPEFTETDPGQVSGTYTPVVGNFSNVAYYDDLLWYAPGPGAEHMWTNIGSRKFTSKPLGNKVNGTYVPIVGDFTGDSLDDILWYGPGAAPDTLWQSSGDAVFTPISVSIGGTYAPVVLDDDNEKDDILWAKPGGGASSVWSFSGNGSQHATHAVTTTASAQPLLGDFDGDGRGDVFWYGPGAIADSLWFGSGGGTFTVKPQSVGGTYQPVVNELTPYSPPGKVVGESGPPTDDIFWYRPSGSSSVWYGNIDRTWTDLSYAGMIGMQATTLPVGRSIFFWSPTAPDKVWTESVISPTGNTEPGTGYQPIPGNWYGVHEILFYKPGPAPEILFT